MQRYKALYCKWYMKHPKPEKVTKTQRNFQIILFGWVKIFIDIQKNTFAFILLL